MPAAVAPVRVLVVNQVNWLEVIVTLVVGAILGVILHALLLRFFDRQLRRFAKSRIWRKMMAFVPRHEPNIGTYDPTTDGLFQLWTWSTEKRPLTEQYHTIVYRRPPQKQDWVDSRLLRQKQKRCRDQHQQQQGGQLEDRPSVGYVTSFTQDHREYKVAGPQGQSQLAERFDLYASRSYFSDAEALGQCFETPEELADLKRRLTEASGPDLLRGIPPTRLAIEVALVSSDFRFLAVQRSTTVTSDPGYWTVGLNETLVPPPADFKSPGGRPEDLFELAKRCLREEAALDDGEFGTIHISWFGLMAPCLIDIARPNSTSRATGIYQLVLAQAACLVPDESEVLRRIADSHSNYEASSSCWLPLTARQVEQIVNMKDKKRWIYFAPLAVRELWRFRARIREELETHSLADHYRS